MIKKKYVIISILSIVFLSWQYGQMRKTSLQFLDRHGVTHTLSLPEKDRERLFNLMEKLFAEDNFAYTALGSKPLSWACYQKPLPFVDWTTFHDSFRKYHRTLRTGWKTWEKYQHLFPLNSFWIEESERYSGWVSILMINEEQFNAVVNHNKEDFQRELSREITNGYQLLEEAKNSPLMSGVLRSHQALMGIVLGYGKENSWKFLKSCETRKPVGWVWGEMGESLFGQDAEKPLGMSLTEWRLSVDSCPSFAGIPDSEESLALKDDYLQTRQKVLEYYKGKDFLEATLSLLAGHRPEK